MKILIIQKNNFTYPRNLALQKCFEKLDDDCQFNFFEFNFLKKIKLILQSEKIVFIWSAQFLIGWIVLAKILGKEVIIDMFNFYYETYVEDRKLVKNYSLKSAFYYLLDYMCIKLANKVFVDTEEHGEYMTSLYGEVKYFVLPVIIDEDLIGSISADNSLFKNGFTVLYCGKFIPLHGVEKIIDAIVKLKNEPINFYLQGSGQTRTRIEEMVSQYNLEDKVIFIDRLPYEKMLALIKASDLCLGVFGDSEKTKRVIPNKVFEALACGKPIITLTTKAMDKIRSNNGLILIENHNMLAETIKSVYNSKVSGENITVDKASILANFGIKSGVNILKGNLYG